MTGTFINVAAILIASVISVTTAWNLSAANQFRAKFLLGCFVVYAGMSAIWNSVHGTFTQVLLQLLILLISLIIGNVIGKLLRLQKLMNRMGRFARVTLQQAGEEKSPTFSDAFLTCSILFCITPIALLGALQEGLAGGIRTLVIKSVMDSLAALAFGRLFGWSVALAALPVLAYQGTITLLARAAHPFLRDHALLDSVTAANGLLILFLSLVIFEIKKVELGDYLPILVVAPFLTWLF